MAEAGYLSPKAVFIDGTHIKANANTKKQVKAQVPAASKHYAKELMEEVNADREAHGKKPFDDDDEPPTQPRSAGTTPPRRNWPGGKREETHGDKERDRPGQRLVCEGRPQAAVCL